MDNKLTSIVDRKINEKQENTKVAMKNTFADTIRMNLNENTIGKAVRESVNNELVQDTERTKREKNLIIHGITERGFNKIEQEEYDNL